MFDAEQLYLGSDLGRQLWHINRNGRSGHHKREEIWATLLFAYWSFRYNALRR